MGTGTLSLWRATSSSACIEASSPTTPPSSTTCFRFPSRRRLLRLISDISKRPRRLQAPARLYNPSQATAICGPDCKRVRGLETCRQGRQSARMCSTSTTRDCGARTRLGRLHVLARECQKPQSVGILFHGAHIILNVHIIAARSRMYGMRNKSCIFVALVPKSEILQANEVLVILRTTCT